jgi:hypothetical protein
MMAARFWVQSSRTPSKRSMVRQRSRVAAALGCRSVLAVSIETKLPDLSDSRE